MTEGEFSVVVLKVVPGREKAVVDLTAASDDVVAAECVTFGKVPHVKPQTVREFLAAVAAGSPDESTIADVVMSCGYHIKEGRGNDRTIAAVEACRAILTQYGEGVLRDVLTLVQATWGMKRDGVRSSVLRAVADLLSENLVDRDRFAAKVAARYDLPRLLKAAEAARAVLGGGLSESVRLLLARAYNHGLKGGRIA